MKNAKRPSLGLLAAALLAACGDPVQRHIDAIVEGGDDLERAKLALNMAKGVAVTPVIRAFEDDTLPVRARLDMADALYRLYLREEAPAIFESLVAALEDPLPEVRAGAARAVGNLRRRQAVEPLLATFTAESDPGMKLEILTALEFMSMSGDGGGHVTPHLFSDTQKRRFAEDLLSVGSAEGPDLHGVATEWLEVLAEDRAADAHRLQLAADVAGAEALLLSALELRPESKNIGQRLGRLYFDSGDPQRATEYLEGRGMVARAAPLPAAPTLDGRLAGDPGWAGVEPLTGFYQCIWRMSALRTEGRSEAYVGYRRGDADDTLFVAVKGYEPSREALVAETTTRDGQVHRDDCIEIFLDVNHDFQSFHQLIFNTLGTVEDLHVGPGFYRHDWNASHRVGTAVADTFWVAEVAIPVRQLDGAQIRSGDIWGFNVSRVRIGNASEYGQWVPTYGQAQKPDRFGVLVFE